MKTMEELKEGCGELFISGKGTCVCGGSLTMGLEFCPTCEALMKQQKELFKLIAEKVLLYWKGQNEFVDWLNKQLGVKK